MGSRVIPVVHESPELYQGVPVVPRRSWARPLVDYELGRANPEDNAAPFDTVWVSGLDGESVYVERQDGQFRQTLFGRPDVSWISFGFDQLMRPAVAYISAGVPYFYWYDPTVPGMVHTAVPEAHTPLVYLDDCRKGESSNSDVTLVYLRGRSLYSRVQRERYEVERLLKADAGSRLARAGMTNNLRVNWRLTP